VSKCAEVVTLDRSDTGAYDIASLGGKGAALATMIAADLPVPATAVVTTDAYRRAVLDPQLVELLAGLADSARSGFDDHDVDRRFAEAGLPEGVRDAIVSARRHVAPDGPVAVRSSATTEDLGGASFAGQYVSRIGMETDDELVDAVIAVWASLWHRAPVLYRQLHGMAGEDVAMAVVIQAMVPAIRSGVVFTVDPGGREDHLRVEHVAGFGEALVSGAVTPDAAVLPRAAGERGPNIVETAVQLALRSEDLFGSAQDVEWADDGTETWLVQSRPITTHTPTGVDDGFDSVVGTHRRFTTAGIGEMLPGVFPLLSWATAGFMVEESFRQVMSRLGALPSALPDNHGFIVRLRGRAALDLDHLSEVATELPGGSAEQLEHEFFGVGSTDGVDDTVPLHARVGHDLRVLATHRFARREQAVTHAAIEAVLDAEVSIGTLTDRELLALRARLVDLGVRSTVAEFAIAAAAVAAVRNLEQLTAKHFGEQDGPAWARRVTRGVPTVGVLRLVANVGRLLRENDAPVSDHDTWESARNELVAGGHETTAAAIERAAVRAGSQRVIGGTAWFEDLDRFWHLVRDSARRHPPDDEPNALPLLEHELVSLPGWRRFRILTGQVVDVRRLMVRRAGLDAVDLLARRETAKADVLALGGQIRAVDLELGARLARLGALSHPTDVEHLRPNEIRSALEFGSAVRLDVILRRRRTIERWRADDELPVTFTGIPGTPDATAPPGDRFDGWGASSGRHTGPVRVLQTPNETEVTPGDVVVARRTDASWLPVFLRAGAVVVEEGGPLSHAAIVARELDVPAVVNVPGVVARLRNEGGQVTVDGDIGAVFVTSTVLPADAPAHMSEATR
jgi:pyruvate,water dikinase